ncbi:hypothetical protein [Paenibacillus caui]|uniref:hypothetical protein n=1 Tax=Paenibacillus caui TaxID=2873927 RepID=UPI001CA7D4C8|nr:hypothetical protein [Paenibacillus caui]
MRSTVSDLRTNDEERLAILISFLLSLLFYRDPAVPFSKEEEAAYRKIWEEAVSRNGGQILYESPFPKHRFLQYLSHSKPVLFHGSNYKEIAQFEPRRQTLYNGEYVDAVFSTSDGIWPIFYAVFDRHKLVGNFRNGCLEAGRTNHRFYFFSLSDESIHQEPWTEGMVYILPREPFDKAGRGLVFFDEWISKEPVRPLFRLKVSPDDFIFRDKVSSHESREPLIKTMILYKLRTIWNR